MLEQYLFTVDKWMETTNKDVLNSTVETISLTFRNLAQLCAGQPLLENPNPMLYDKDFWSEENPAQFCLEFDENPYMSVLKENQRIMRNFKLFDIALSFIHPSDNRNPYHRKAIILEALRFLI